MATELAKTYDPKAVEKEMYDLWVRAGTFDAQPDGARASTASRSRRPT